MNRLHDENKLTSKYKYQELVIDDNKYLIAVRNRNNIREVLVTDLVNFYEENLSKENISKRCKELNPVLIDCNFEDIIDNLLLNISKYTVSSTLNYIQLEDKIDDGRFFFHIKLKKSSIDSYKNEFMNKFYFSFFEIHHRYNCLLSIVKKKDQEIIEYKAHGIEIPRKNLLSEPFNEKVFTKCSQNAKTFDKIDIFLNAMNFYNIIENDQDSQFTPESRISMVESSFDNLQSELKSTIEGKPIKRYSSDIRCAVAPKTERKIKINKQPNDYIIKRL